MVSFKAFRASLDNNLITVTTDLQGMITFASKAYLEISGYTMDELVDTPFGFFGKPDRPDAEIKVIRQSLKVGKVWQGELKQANKNLDFYWVDVKVIPHFDAQEKMQSYTVIMHDITDRKRLEELTRRVVEEEQQIASYLEIINDYVITSTADAHYNITSASRAFCEISGYSETELIGQKQSIVRHPDMPDASNKHLWSTISNGLEWKGEVKNITKTGQDFWVDLYIKPNKDQAGNIIGFTSIRHDITDKKKLEALTIKDELTGAYNRRFYNQVLDIEINRAKRNKLWVGFLMVDADNFKKYNDSYGHQQGDEVLKSITAALSDTFRRSGDYVFRLGGEEFAVLYNTESKNQLLTVAERSRQAMFDMNIEHSGNAPHYRVTVSMGLMELDPEMDYVSEEIYKYADEALYRAKQNGRNCIEVVEPDNDNIELF